MTTCSLALLMMWVQVLESVHLAHCAEAYNFSLAIAVCGAAAAGLCATPIQQTLATRRASIICISMLSGACGAASVIVQGELAATLLCLHIMFTLPVLVAFGSRLANVPPKLFFPLVCAAGILVCAVLPFVSEHLAAVATVMVLTAPVAGFACYYALSSETYPEGRLSEGQEDTSPSLPVATTSRATAAVLCATLLAASLFAGFVTSPIYANSQTAGTIAATLAVAMLFIMAVAGAVLTRRGNAYRSITAAAILQAAICLSMLVMVVGLFLFSSGASGTLTYSVGIVLGARQVLAAIAWMLFPLIAARSVNRQRTYAMLVLVSGTIYAPYIGAWASKMTALSFSQLTNVAVGLIALVAACAIASVAFFAATRGNGINRAAKLQPVAAAQGANTAVGLTPAMQKNSVPTIPAHANASPGEPMHAADATASAPAKQEPAQRETASSRPQANPQPARHELSAEELMREVQRRRQLQLEPYGLTERETQIVTLLLDGQTMKGIAEELFITERTVKFHSKNAYVKLGVANKKELMQAFSDLPSPHQETLRPSNS